MASGLRFSTVGADAKLPLGTTLNCPICHKHITALGAIQADVHEDAKASEPIAITDGKMLGWAASCGCLISASVYTLEIRYKTNPDDGEHKVTSVAFTRNPVYRDLPAGSGQPQMRGRAIPRGVPTPPLVG